MIDVYIDSIKNLNFMAHCDHAVKYRSLSNEMSANGWKKEDLSILTFVINSFEQRGSTGEISRGAKHE
jgi:hypothetical protein